MPLKTVDEMVKNRLSFVPQTGWETSIDDFKTEQMYYLDTYLMKDVPDIEVEADWLGVERLLLAEITTYQVLMKEIIETVGGDSTSAAGAGGKLIKSAKADVVEAEFEYAKSDDGRTLSLKASQLIPELKQSICRYATALDICLPGYCPEDYTEPRPPFIVVE